MSLIPVRRAVFLIVSAMAATLMSSCSDNALGPAMVAGRYQLTRVDGKATPAPLFSVATQTWYVDEATLTMTADGKWAMVYPMHFETPQGFRANADPVPTDVGTYTLSGRTLRFQDATSGSEPFTGTVDDGGIVAFHGLLNSFSFQRIEFARP